MLLRVAGFDQEASKQELDIYMQDYRTIILQSMR